MAAYRVLVVEDEGVVAMNTKLSLISMGYDVLPIAISGTSALTIATEHSPDVVLMDIRLRGKIDGIETTLKLREQNITAPVIYVTAHTDDTTTSRAKETAPSAFLEKPVDIQKIAQVIALENLGFVLFSYNQLKKMNYLKRYLKNDL